MNTQWVLLNSMSGAVTTALMPAKASHGRKSIQEPPSTGFEQKSGSPTKSFEELERSGAERSKQMVSSYAQSISARRSSISNSISSVQPNAEGKNGGQASGAKKAVAGSPRA
jgi:hypothetical protein